MDFRGGEMYTDPLVKTCTSIVNEMIKLIVISGKSLNKIQMPPSRDARSNHPNESWLLFGFIDSGTRSTGRECLFLSDHRPCTWSRPACSSSVCRTTTRVRLPACPRELLAVTDIRMVRGMRDSYLFLTRGVLDPHLTEFLAVANREKSNEEKSQNFLPKLFKIIIFFKRERIFLVLYSSKAFNIVVNELAPHGSKESLDDDSATSELFKLL